MNILNEVYTMKEAATLYNIVEGTVRAAIKVGRLKEGVDFRKSGKITLVTKSAMEREWGKLASSNK